MTIFKRRVSVPLKDRLFFLTLETKKLYDGNRCAIILIVQMYLSFRTINNTFLV